MKTYNINIQLNVTCQKDAYNTTTIAQSEVRQAITVPGRQLKPTITQLVRQAVSNLSISADTGLREIIKEEPVEVESNTPDELTV